MDITKVEAILFIKENSEDDINKLKIANRTEEETVVQITPQFETETLTKYDFKQPREQNFLEYVKEVIENPDSLDEGVRYKLLTGIEN